MNEIRAKAVAATAGAMAGVLTFFALFAVMPRVMMMFISVVLLSAIFIGVAVMIYDDFNRVFTRRARKRADSNRS